MYLTQADSYLIYSFFDAWGFNLMKRIQVNKISINVFFFIKNGFEPFNISFWSFL